MTARVQASALARLLAAIWRSHRARLFVTYGATLIENVCELLYAATVGIAIDGLLTRQPLAMVPLVALWVGHLCVGLFRHVYDTRVFTGIYAGVADDLVVRQRTAGIEENRIIGRVALSREIVDFLQDQVPAIATSIVRFGGAVLMMAVYDLWIGIYAMLALVPVVVINLRFAGWAQRLNEALNNQLEREPVIVAKRPLPIVTKHFQRLRFWRVLISNAEARTWGMLEAVLIGLTVAVLLRMTSNGHESAGSIYAILAYVLTFSEGVWHLPDIIQKFARVRDIGERVAGEPA